MHQLVKWNSYQGLVTWYYLWLILSQKKQNNNSKRIRILTKSRLEGSIYLGLALWRKLEKNGWILRDPGKLKAFCVQRNKCIVQPAREMQIWCSIRLCDIWLTMASITLWNIWESRCKACLSGEVDQGKRSLLYGMI